MRGQESGMEIMSNYLFSLSRLLFPADDNRQADFEEGILSGEIKILFQEDKTSIVFHRDEDFFKYAEYKKLRMGLFDGILRGWLVRIAA